MSVGAPSQVDPGATVLIEKPKPRDLPQVGETFGGYRIERELGHGGMGAVYAAEHLESGRRVALKVLSRQLDSPEARARFLREGRLAASINHPNSVYVFGTEEVEGTPVIAMELIAGGTLQERVQRGGPLPVGQAVDAALQIIAGLEAAQAIGILHRDIKPANCFEDMDGTVKVGDFGLSISTAARGESHLTLPGDFLGTPAFCSPEQLRGDELNVRSDMYAVGVTLFYLLTGRAPFEGKNMVQLLANALEKSAPSPSQFRPEIPQSLSNVVLRCLEKLPASRYGSYEELRRALIPFGSTAPTPATLGLRFVAMIVDSVVCGALNWMVILLCYRGDLERMADPARFQDGGWMWVTLGLYLLQLCYWGILEGVWGASVGKALVGLRVARLNRSAPGIPRAMARELILKCTTLALFLLPGDYYRHYDSTSRETQITSFIFLGLSAAYSLALFVTARRRNGFAAVHDLLTGTRVIQKSAYQPRNVITQDETPVATTETMPRLGPYHVLTELATGDGDAISLGYDTRMLRKVWIRRTRPGEPPVPPMLRNIARPGRLRWLQGERTASESWDAYEAANGTPMVNLLNERQLWSSVRHWLLDLATELEAGKRDGTLPGVLALDRVWITLDGRAKLLDFAAPGAVPAGQTASANVGTNIFLNQVAMSALEGRMASREEASTRTVSVPLALRARAFVKGLITSPQDASLMAELKPLLQEKPCVSRRKRAAILFALAAPALMMGASLIVAAQLSHTFMQSRPELLPLTACLLAYQDLANGKSRATEMNLDPLEAKAAMEVHIAGKYGHVIRDSHAWFSPMFKTTLKPDLRAAAERMVAEHPQPTSEEMKKAETLLQPLIKGLEDPAIFAKHGDIRHILNSMTGLVMCWVMTATAVVSLVCAVLFRRGLLFQILGISVVTDNGADASRLRLLGRGLIAWSPVLLSAVTLYLSMAGSPSNLIAPSLVMGVLVLVFAIASIIPRERSLQDMLAGTWLVPA